ncbi:hypothetical protein BELL_0509g00100 [Botrytis elliptica]|uniref:Uncharacterized protein n=1 Tax=Botrytis elliptica TaxID=278938 RepID=A0A4Z1JDX6_9HELO|nr:hypothetical protein BELL_0509g00100 [Botrytis elliptica]
MSNYIEATIQDQHTHEVNELAARLKRLNIEDTFQRNRKHAPLVRKFCLTSADNVTTVFKWAKLQSGTRLPND